MSESDTASVECPLCGEAFDPAAAGGWCTNSECGEWQFETDVTPDQQTAADDAGDAVGDAGDDSDASGDPDAEAEPAVADESGEPDASPEVVDGADEAETFDCPGCGSALESAVNFCPDGGEDVSDLPGDGEDELEACPSCDGDVEPDDNFCAQCGEDLDAHRGQSDSLDECPDCGAEVDEDDGFCADCGADLDARRAGEADAASAQSEAADSTEQSGSTEGSSEPAPDALALTAHEKSVVVGDGDVVGREIRSLLTEAGRPEDEAVRVHREHLRFVRESDRFYVVGLGQNPTRVNGRSLEQGDRETIAPGDELELSNVVTLDVETA